MRRLALLILSLTAVLLFAACDTGGTTPPPGPGDPSNPGDPNNPGGPGDGIPGPLHSIRLSPRSGTVPQGATLTITAHAYDEDGDELPDINITITSDNPAILQLNTTGTATAKAIGNATITAQAEETTATTTINVTPASTAPKGITWEMLPPYQAVTANAIAVRGDDLYVILSSVSNGAAQNPGLLHSEDGGTTWRPVYSEGGCAPYQSSLIADPSHKGRLLRSCSTSISVSVDFGWTWQQKYSGSGIGSFDFHPSDPSFVTSGSRLYSTDAGESWATTGALGELTVSNQDTRYWVDKVSTTDVRISEDWGVTWTSVTLPGRPDRGDPRCTNEWVWAGLGVSSEGTLGLVGRQYCGFAPAGAAYLHAFFASNSRGQSWEARYQVESGDYQLMPANTANIYFGGSEETIYLMGNSPTVEQGIRVSRDGGRSWTQTAIPATLYASTFMIWDGNDGTAIANPYVSSGIYYRTADFGATWTEVRGLPTPTYLKLLQIGQETYALGSNGTTILKSDDFFATSTTMREMGMTATQGPEVITHLVTQGEVRASTGLISSDLGTSWAGRGASSPMAQSPSEPNRWYYGSAAGRVWVSNDDGSTRTIAGATPYFDPVRILAPSHTNANLVYALTNSGVYRSEDAGATWKWASYGLQHAEYLSDLVVDPTDHNTLYVSSQDVQKSVDGGQSWSYADPRAEFGRAHVNSLAITSDGSTIFAATNGSAVYRSLDAGQSWEWVTSGLKTHAMRDVVVDPSDDDVVYLATIGGVYKSTDKGSSWVNASQEVFTPYIDSIAVSPDGQNIYASTTHHWIYRGQPSSNTGTIFPASFLNQVTSQQDTFVH